MNTSLVALYALLIQQALFGALWVILVYLRVARRASLNWAVGIAFVTGGLGLTVLRADLPRWLGYWGAAVLLYVGFVWARRGLEVFARLQPRDGQLAAGAVAYAVFMAGITAWGSPGVYVAAGSLPLGWLLIAAGRAVRRSLTAEFGRKAAWFGTLPVVAIGAVMAGRGLLALVGADAAEVPIHAGGRGNVHAALMFVACGVVFNLGLCALVATRMMLGLRRASERDHLTGLYNRRTVEARWASHWASLRAGGPPLALLSIDIDHFKAINDNHGHPAGDAVLRQVADTLSAQLRPEDVAGRVGGEEFWVLLPGLTGNQAALMADRVQRAVRELEITVRDVVPLKVTVSMGLAEASRAGETADAVLQRLDEALYRAKAAGRNRWEWAVPPAAAADNVRPLARPGAQDGPSASASPASPGTPRTTDDCSVV